MTLTNAHHCNAAPSGWLKSPESQYFENTIDTSGLTELRQKFYCLWSFCHYVSHLDSPVHTLQKCKVHGFHTIVDQFFRLLITKIHEKIYGKHHAHENPVLPHQH